LRQHSDSVRDNYLAAEYADFANLRLIITKNKLKSVSYHRILRHQWLEKSKAEITGFQVI
jgi:hypothetical protein